MYHAPSCATGIYFLSSDPLAPVLARATRASSFFLPHVDHRVEPRQPYPTRAKTRSATRSICFVQWVKKKEAENWQKPVKEKKKKKILLFSFVCFYFICNIKK
jgi:hypothetical protein